MRRTFVVPRFLPLLTALGLLVDVAPAAAQRQPGGPACSQPLADPITIVNVPGGSANPTLSRDGCWLFVMVNRPNAEGGPGVVVLRRSDQTFAPVRTVAAPYSSPMSGMLLTNDQNLLVVAAAGSLTFIDVEKATTGDTEAVLGHMRGLPGAFKLTITPDDKHLFIPQYGPGRVAMLDLERARASRFAADSLVAGVIPTGRSPITAVVSRDGRHVYSTNLVAPDVLAGPPTCIDGKQREGGIQIIDVAKAKADPESATLGWAFPAGCGPNAMTLSPDGSRLSNTAGNNIIQNPDATGMALVVFDATPVRDGKLPTRIGAVPVPKGPIGVVDTGSRIIIGFQRQGESYPELLVVDPSKVAAGAEAIVGTIPYRSGGLSLSADGRTLIAANLTGDVALIDLDRVTVRPAAR
jgi:DNA-binding beta-propeller fold protein YncE